MADYNLKTPDRPVGLLRAVEKLMYWAQVSLPAVYGEELTYAKEQGKMAAKINEVVEQLNVNTEWTQYLLDEGVEKETIAYINLLVANGTLANLINNTLLKNIQDDLNKRLDIQDGKIESIVTPSPAGVFKTLAELIAAIGTDKKRIYVVEETNGWYYWDGTTWALGGTYLNPINVENINQKNLAGYALTKNLFNPDDPDTIINGYIGSGGVVVSSDTLNTTGFIPVAIDDYVSTSEIWKTTQVGNRLSIPLYDENKTYLRNVSVESSVTNPSFMPGINGFYRIPYNNKYDNIYRTWIYNSKAPYRINMNVDKGFSYDGFRMPVSNIDPGFNIYNLLPGSQFETNKNIVNGSVVTDSNFNTYSISYFRYNTDNDIITCKDYTVTPKIWFYSINDTILGGGEQASATIPDGTRKIKIALGKTDLNVKVHLNYKDFYKNFPEKYGVSGLSKKYIADISNKAMFLDEYEGYKNLYSDYVEINRGKIYIAGKLTDFPTYDSIVLPVLPGRVYNSANNSTRGLETTYFDESKKPILSINSATDIQLGAYYVPNNAYYISIPFLATIPDNERIVTMGKKYKQLNEVTTQELFKLNGLIVDSGTMDNPWSGKLAQFFGTSITSTSYGKYVNPLAVLSGLSVENYGIPAGTAKQIYNSIKTNLKAEASLVVVEGFANDWGNTAIGDTLAEDEDTLSGLTFNILKYICENSNARILFVTDQLVRPYGEVTYNGRTYKYPLNKKTAWEYENSVIAVCRTMGIDVVDYCAEGGQNPYTPELYVDHIHQSEAGGQNLANFIWGHLKNMKPQP